MYCNECIVGIQLNHIFVRSSKLFFSKETIMEKGHNKEEDDVRKKLTALSYFVNEHCGGIPELILQNL